MSDGDRLACLSRADEMSAIGAAMARSVLLLSMRHLAAQLRPTSDLVLTWRLSRGFQFRFRSPRQDRRARLSVQRYHRRGAVQRQPLSQSVRPVRGLHTPYHVCCLLLFCLVAFYFAPPPTCFRPHPSPGPNDFLLVPKQGTQGKI